MIRFYKIFSLLLAFTISGLFASGLFAGTKEEIIRLQNDVLQLQKKIDVLQKIVDERNATIISLLEQLNDQMANSSVSMQDVVSAIREQSSSMGNSIGQVREDLQGLSIKLDDTNSRVAAVHRKVEDNQLQVQSFRTPTVGPTGLIDPDSAFFAARTDFQMGNYELAIAGLQDFLANFPDSEQADNAAYLLGDCYAKQGRHQLAVQAFDQVINLYPDGDKAAVAYFKKAVSLESMQRMDQAVDTLRKLAQLFPDSQEAKLAQEELAKIGLGDETPG